MKELYVNEDMKKWQDQARKMYKEEKNVDAGKVFLGWNLHAGTVIVDEQNGVTTELLSENSDGTWKVRMSNAEKTLEGNTTRDKIALIVLRGAIVYY